MSIDSINREMKYVSTNNVSPNFRGDNVSRVRTDVALKKPIDKDTVELSTKKQATKKNSTGKKILVALGSGLATLATAGLLIYKREMRSLKKLYNEKLVLSDLPKHIEFKEAKTLDEGIKFAKEVLKIPEVDKNFTLESINFANKGLVDVSNANNGHLFLPRKLIFTKIEKEKNTVAYVVRNIKSKDFGSLTINSELFDSKYLDNKINNFLKIIKDKNISDSVPIEIVHSRKENPKDVLYFKPLFDKKVIDICKKYNKNKSQISLQDKLELYSNINAAGEQCKILTELSPMRTLKDNQKLFKNSGVKYDIENFEKLSLKEQSDEIFKMFKKVQDAQGKIFIDVKYNPPENIIHHELGHLQDYAKNLKELDFAYSSIGWKNSNALYKKYGKGAHKIKLLENRWRGLTYEGFDDLFKNNPQEFKVKYPDLYEFLTDKKMQETAGKVSEYATTSIGEFIAETYGKMVRGEKLADDVVELYKKFNGPMIPFG